MKKNEPSTIPRSRSILYFALTLIFLPFFVNNAYARHTETKVGWAANGISTSRHNLASSGQVLATGGGEDKDGNIMPDPLTSIQTTTEICVFCHTPHFADRGKGPLWNRNFAGGTVEAYGTTIAKNNDGNQNMFSSIGCLSCHDGVTTFDSLINKPGKDTAGLGGASPDKQWNFRMKVHIQGSGGYSYDHFSSASCTTCHDQDGSPDVLDDPISRLIIGEQNSPGYEGKTNLSNDHPIGVIYRGNGDANASASLRARTVNISEINMDIETENSAPMAVLVSGNLWAVKGFISNSATIQDLLRSGTGQGSGNYVQCSSCHDPHFKNQTNPEAWFYRTYKNWDGIGITNTPVTSHDAFEVDGLFLRRVGGNSDSGLCRTCHDKG